MRIDWFVVAAVVPPTVAGFALGHPMAGLSSLLWLSGATILARWWPRRLEVALGLLLVGVGYAIDVGWL